MPGFINIKVSKSFLLNQIKAMAKNKKIWIGIARKTKNYCGLWGGECRKAIAYWTFKICYYWRKHQAHWALYGT